MKLRMDASPESGTSTTTEFSSTSGSGPEQKRARMCPSWPSSSASMSASEQSIDVEVKHHRRKKSRKLKNHKDSSKATEEELTKYLDIDSDACPTNEHPGEELRGATANELVQDLLNDMQNKQFPFPVKTYEDLVRDMIGSMPEAVRQKQEEVITQPLQELLNQVDFKDGNSKELVESYEELYCVVRQHYTELYTRKANSKNLFERNVYGDLVLLPLKKFLQCVTTEPRHGVTRLPIDDDDSSIDQDTAQREFVHFWEGLLFTTKTRNVEGDHLFSVRTNGHGKDLRVKLKPKPGVDVPTVIFHTRGDILCEAVAVRGEDELYSQKTLLFDIKTHHLKNMKIGLCAKGIPSLETLPKKHTSASDNTDTPGTSRARSGQTSRHEFAIPSTPKGSSSHSDRRKTPTQHSRDDEEGPDDDSEDPESTVSDLKYSKDTTGSPSKSSILVNSPMDSRLDALRTQHVLELLSMIEVTDQSDTTIATMQAHGIGLYIVMHRIYVTGLFSVTDNPGLYSYIIKMDPRIRRATGNKYQLKCCKYFNLFKPGHMTALMEFIQYLLFHQYKVMPLFG